MFGFGGGGRAFAIALRAESSAAWLGRQCVIIPPTIFDVMSGAETGVAAAAADGRRWTSSESGGKGLGEEEEEEEAGMNALAMVHAPHPPQAGGGRLHAKQTSS
eukprot:723065-Rhodomonas_salina.1